MASSRPTIATLLRWLGLLLCLLVSSVSCQRSDGPQLLLVSDVGPERIELGDRVSVVGDKFVEGRAAKVELSGTLHRSGEPDVEGFTAEFSGRSESRNAVSFTPSETELKSLVDGLAGARHTTFRGSVRVAFRTRSDQAPEVHGVLDEVVLDFLPPASDAGLVRAREREARDLLTFVGITLEEASMKVLAVKPNGRGEKAGLEAGDVVLAMQGVNVLSLEDLVVSGSTRSAKLAVRRGRLSQPVQLALEVEGFRPRAAADLLGAATVVGVVVFVLVFFAAPIARLLPWLERRVLSRTTRSKDPSLRLHGKLWSGLFQRALARDLLPLGLLGACFRPAPYVVFLLTSVAMTWIAMGQSLLLDALDLLLVYLTSVTAVVAAALLLGGWRGRSQWSLFSGLKSALATLVFQIPALFSLGVVLVSRGSLASREVAATQGAWPWNWNAFASPMLLLASISFVATCIPEASRRTAPVHDGPSELDHRASRSVMYLAEWTQLWIVATLSSVVFLGGASLPGVDGGGGLGALLLGAAWLQLKTWIVVAVVLWLRWSVVRVRPDELLGVWLRWLVPFSCCALVLASGYAAGAVEGTLSQETQRATSIVVFAVVVVLTSYSVIRIVRASRAGVAPPSLNPWL